MDFRAHSATTLLLRSNMFANQDTLALLRLLRRNKPYILESVSSTTSVDSNPRTKLRGFFLPSICR
jgi:hypothetical protein